MNPDPLSTNDRPMQYRDAIYVATVLMILLTATTFMPAHNYDKLSEDPQRYAYELCVFLLQSWITSFCGLTGLIVYVQTKQAREGSGSG